MRHSMVEKSSFSHPLTEKSKNPNIKLDCANKFLLKKNKVGKYKDKKQRQSMKNKGKRKKNEKKQRKEQKTKKNHSMLNSKSPLRAARNINMYFNLNQNKFSFIIQMYHFL